MSRKRQHRSPPTRHSPTLDIQSAQAMAIKLHRSGQLDDAETLYQRILHIQPNHPDILHFLGMLRHQRGDSTDGLRLIEQSIAHQPDYADAHNSLGNILNSLGQTDEAIAAYRRAIACRADFAEAFNNLGVALRVQGELAEAIQVLQRGIAIKPDYADAYFSLGRALSAADQLDAAIEAIQEGLRRNPRRPGGYRQLGRLFYRLNRIEEAVACYRQWAEQNPDDPEAQYMLAAVTGENVPERAADRYIQDLFDGFADSFDKNLQGLDYQAPNLLAAVIATEWPTPDAALQVLDAGCGTGWCGPLLRPYAQRLVGVDLSPGMTNKARARKVYDELAVAELTAFMQTRRNESDLIVSADTLIYFGDLSAALAAAAGALRPGGRLAFTLEKLETDAAAMTFHLNPHGRYSHAEPYLRRELAAAGLTLRSLTTATLRFELKQPVIGFVVLAVKPESDRIGLERKNHE
jgi:predicted TPR repeat methyltransferase